MKWLPRVVAFFVGALSLMQEILWTRVVSFVEHGVPESFATVLVYYLVGIAVGAHAGKLACLRSNNLVSLGGKALFVSALLGTASPFIYLCLHDIGFPSAGFAPLIVATAASSSVLFPIVHHLGSNYKGPEQGRSFSWVYFSNVLGCTAGPLIAALIVLDILTLQASFVLVGALTFMLASYVFISARESRLAALGILFSLASMTLMAAPNVLVRGIADRLNGEDGMLTHIIETKEGIIHTESSPLGDIVFGNNVYDGRINVDLRVDSNKIDRAYALALAHPDAKSALIIGMSGGSWTEVLSTFQSMERIDAVEINPAFIDLIRRYPQVASILDNPKINIHIDDGRRWLRNNTDKKFDLMALNTSYFWRANSTSLLSEEFIRLAKSRLNEGGIILINTTGSPDVFHTAASVFPFAYLYGNSVIASDHDFRSTFKSKPERIYATVREGKPAFNSESATDISAIQSMMAIPFMPIESIRNETPRELQIITDDNMITEFKFREG